MAVGVFEPYRTRKKYWLNVLLLSATLLTTTLAGVDLALGFALGQPFFIDGDWFGSYARVWHHPALLLTGLPFSLTLLAILMAHELGHYIAAMYYRVDATLPFFLPAPTLIGTFGAFIRIRSPIQTKRALFDIGVAGPIAGFVVLVVALGWGITLSRVIPGAAERGDLIFGTPLLLQWFASIRFPGVRLANILIHPIARAAWVGMLTTALNLLPIGQLDGGHILYAFLGERTRVLSRIFVASLLLLGGYQMYDSHFKAGVNWLIWAVVLFFLALRHPMIYDPQPLGTTRTLLGFAALAIFFLSFMVSPVHVKFR